MNTDILKHATPEQLTTRIVSLSGKALVIDLCVLIVVGIAAQWWVTIIVFAYGVTSHAFSRQITALKVLCLLRTKGMI